MLSTNIYLLACAAIGFLFGLHQIFRNKPPVYFHLIVFAMASQLFSRIFYVVSIACYGGIPDVFNVGFIGFGTFMLFLYFANYGPLDAVVDDRNKTGKYRWIAVLLPTAELVIAVFALMTDYSALSVRISLILLSLMAGSAGYLHLKHIIIPDEKGGIGDSIKGFNLLCIFTEILSLLEIAFHCFGIPQYVIYIQALLGVCFIVMLPLLNREVRKWVL